MVIRKISLAGILLMLASTTVQADLRVSSSEGMKAAVSRPAPAYSAIARQMQVAGRVEVEATIAADGSVESVRPVTGNPLLTQSAVQAVQKWKFTPFTANGEPTKAVMMLAFEFKP